MRVHLSHIVCSSFTIHAGNAAITPSISTMWGSIAGFGVKVSAPSRAEWLSGGEERHMYCGMTFGLSQYLRDGRRVHVGYCGSREEAHVTGDRVNMVSAIAALFQVLVRALRWFYGARRGSWGRKVETSEHIEGGVLVGVVKCIVSFFAGDLGSSDGCATRYMVLPSLCELSTTSPEADTGNYTVKLYALWRYTEKETRLKPM